MNPLTTRAPRPRGITLIEFLVVMMVIAILAAVATPSFQGLSLIHISEPTRPY